MNHLTSEQRYEIYLGRKSGWSRNRIAREIGVHIVKQTIYNHVHADTTGKLAPHLPHELKYT